MNIITKEMVFSAIPPRNENTHKGTYGKVLAICGCDAYRGAAALSCMGALRIGAGLVTLAAPERVIASIAGRILEATFLCLPDDAALQHAAQSATVCLVGCGKQETEQTMQEAKIAAAAGPVVLDAGALFTAPLLTHKGLVVTPHPGEMAKLAGISVAQVLQMPATVALRLAKKLNAVVVLKMHRTIVATAQGALYENRTGNAGLARGGSGDVLAGIIAGLIAQGLSLEQAAFCGVWLHGSAADFCAKTNSKQTLLPEDLPGGLSQLFLENNR